MPEERVTRRLAAIVSADVAGYSRLVGRDEVGTLAALKTLRRGIVDPRIESHGGRIVKTMGDGLLLDFPSVVDAARCAIEIQTVIAEHNADVPTESRIVFRIGINIGDIIIEGDDIFGDGVNIAARLQEIAEPGGICLSGRVHDDIRDRLNAAFVEGGSQALKNIARPVPVWRWMPGAIGVVAPIPSAPASHPALPDKPSIAVLPFENMSADPEQEYFVDGLVEDIITALSRFRSLFVIARNSSFTYKGKAVDIKQVGRELGVRYVLEGSIRKAGNKVRIAGQLIQADTGAHIWAERYDGEITDIFELQDTVALDVVGAITPTVERAEIERAKYKPTESHSAYDCYLRALALGYGGGTLEEARHLCRRAIELDPDYAAAHALSALFVSRRRGLGLPVDTVEVDEALRLVSRAVQLDDQDSFVLSVAGWVHGFLSHDPATAAGFLTRALAMHPNLAMAWAMSGYLNTWLGNPESGIDHFSRSMRLSPRDINISFVKAGSAHAHMMAGRYDEASALAKMSVDERPVSPNLRVAAACWGLAGHLEEAQRYCARLLQADPQRRLSNLHEVLGPYRRPQDLERYQEGLRRAGLPE